MPAINAITQQKIKGYLEALIEKIIEDCKESDTSIFEDKGDYLSKRSEKGGLQPFHIAISEKAITRISAFEQQLRHSLDETFAKCARLIAIDHHQYAERGYDVAGFMSHAALNEIEAQVTRYDRDMQVADIRPSMPDMVSQVLAARREDDLEKRTVRADLYILTHDDREVFFEIKSPKPNKGQCFEVTQRLLRFHLLRGKPHPEVCAYFAMAYNPFGPERADYRWSIPKKYMPFDSAVVIGQEFWTLIGGPTTYEELLDIYREVGKSKGKYILDTLAFGF